MVKSTAENLSNNMMNEFKKSFLDDVDFHFIIILTIALIIETVIALVMAQKPIEEYSQNEIERIQERFANFVLKQPEILPTSSSEVDLESASNGASQSESAEVADEAGGGSRDEGSLDASREGSSESRQADRMAAAEARKESRANLSAQVSNKGLLGMLTGTGSSVEGNAVSSLFGASGSNTLAGDLDEVLSSAGGLKTQGQSGLSGSGNGDGVGNVRGSRSGRKASIDDLVTNTETTGSSSLSRKGDLVVETPTDASGRGSKSAYRSPDAIQEVLLGHVAAVRYCYERELKRNPSLKGKVQVKFTVGPDGNVTSASIVNSTLNNERIERCILSRIRLWKDFKPIDQSEGDASYRQTYTFGY